jgi:cation diffusion facilitator CzcD-associated flavoprotein CzcO
VTVTDTEIAIVGSGFSGLAMAAALRRAGRNDFVVLEKAGRVGGTWRDNTYPGCACDVPSHLYSFSFAPNPEWSSTFSPQPEIQAYLEQVAEREGILAHVRFDTALQEASWDEESQRWRLRTSAGDMTARALIAAAGPLSEPSIPDVPGLPDFPGPVFHSATWDHDHDLTGERVAVVGTGASAIQFVPEIQPKVAALHLFQRTAPWILPRRERPLTRLERTAYRRFPALQRAMRLAIYWAREVFALPMIRVRLSVITRRMGLSYLEKEIADPELRSKLTPAYAPGCKRILLSENYLQSLTKPNVDVITGGVTEVRGRTVIGSDGSEREVDTIILGTGFHVTDLPIAGQVRGRDGRTLAETWEQTGMAAHRGTTVAGFPSFFFLLGPNTGLGHNSVMVMAEAQVGYVMQALEHLRGAGSLSPRPDAQAAWNDDVQKRMRGTVWTAGGCASWYLDAAGRNTTLWPDFSFRFRRALARFDAAEYEVAPLRHASPERRADPVAA